MPDKSHKPAVLLVKLSAIGDIVMASGLPSNIKSSLNASRIVWLTEAPYASFIAAHPDVDQVIPWPKKEWSALAKKKRWLSLCRAVRAFKTELSSHHFDIAIDAQGLLKSAFLCWLSGAGRRIGFKSKEHSHWLLTESLNKPDSDDISSEYKALGRYLGANDFTMTLPASGPAVRQAKDALAASGINHDYIVLCPFTTRPQKHWPVQHWKDVIAWLNNHDSLPVIITGGPDDADTASELASGKEHIFSFAGKLSLAASGAILANAHAVVGVDTGLTHLAICHQRPVLALFGSTCPYTKTDNPDATVLYENLPCAPCKRKPVCNGAYDCMRAITPQKVTAWLEKWL